MCKKLCISKSNIVKKFERIIKKNRLNATIKFQFRDLDTFIHENELENRENPNIKRFLGTKLEWEDFNILKNFKSNDYLLLTGDPAIIGVVCSLVSDITNGRYNLLKWDRQEKRYYPIEIDLYGTGAKNDD